MKKTGLVDLGYSTLSIDDCYAEKNRSSAGKIVADPAKFPEGMKNFTDTLKAMSMCAKCLSAVSIFFENEILLPSSGQVEFTPTQVGLPAADTLVHGAMKPLTSRHSPSGVSNTSNMITVLFHLTQLPVKTSSAGTKSWQTLLQRKPKRLGASRSVSRCANGVGSKFRFGATRLGSHGG